MDQIDIAIVTVLYKSESVLEDFFVSLNEQIDCSLTLYVVDNKSPDSSLILSKKLATQMSFKTFFIENEDNFGIAKGNNLGISKALDDGFKYVLLANNDIVMNNNTIAKLADGLFQTEADLVVPKIYYHGTDLIWTAGAGFSLRNGAVYHRGSLQHDKGQFEKRLQINYAPTCFMLVKKNVFKITGMMDEKYFVYFDDADFIYRAIKQKQKLWYIPESSLFHKESTSTGTNSDFSAYYFWRNFVYFNRKNRFIRGYWYIIIQFIFLFTIRIFKVSGARWKLIFKAMLDGMKML